MFLFEIGSTPTSSRTRMMEFISICMNCKDFESDDLYEYPSHISSDDSEETQQFPAAGTSETSAFFPSQILS